MSDTKNNVLKTIKQLQLAIETVDDEDEYRLLRDELYGLIKPEHFHILRADLYHPNFRRRMAAATNLGRLEDEKAAYGMIELLQDPLVVVREMAVFGLGLLGNSEAIPPLLDLLNDYNADIRYRVLIALRELEYAHLEVVLIRAMDDDSQSVREEALTQLSKTGSIKSLPVILKALLERDYDMQIIAETALDRIIPDMKDSAYRFVNDSLSLRERRLILNYLENRNLHYVFTKLYEVLHVGHALRTNSPLAKYGRILNDEAELAFLHSAYERDDIVKEIYNHFRYDNHQSILLVGDAGSGKTAIVHELALRLFKDNITKEHSDECWTILETSTTELITETRFLGEWETKLKKMMEAIEASKNKVIIYLINPNDLLGAGSHSNSEENFADFFTPYLRRGQVKMIAETTDDELSRGLARDPAFLRLFKQIRIPNMSESETLNLIRQKFHHQAFDATPNLPSQAESASHLRPSDSRRKPPLFSASPSVLQSFVHYSLSFMSRTSLPGAACDLLNQVISMKQTEVEEQYAAGSLSLPRQERRLNQITLSVSDITRSLSNSSGIPLSIIDPTLPLDLSAARQWFQSRLVGQPHVIDEVLKRLSIIKTGLNHPNRPLAVYFLVGPTGVGKTYFAKLLAEFLFGDKERLTRFDLSEYQGHYSVEKLIGSPHNKQREGLLTEAIRNQPFSVLLLDEFEKANEELFSLFLQAFDDARLSDAQGKTTDFRQTVILLTSNLGASKTSLSALGFGGDSTQNLRTRIHDKLREFFAPEFLNRLDLVIPFDPLEPDNVLTLVEHEVNDLKSRRGLASSNYDISVTAAARQWLADVGFSKAYGARELRRTIEQSLLPKIADLIIRTQLDNDHDASSSHHICIDIIPRDKRDPSSLEPPLVASWTPPDPSEPSTKPSDSDDSPLKDDDEPCSELSD